MALTDNGLQQVSESYYRDLRSNLANQLLYNILEPGVYNTSVSLSGDPTNFNIIIAAGSVFVFKNTDDLSIPMIVKVTLGASASVSGGSTASYGISGSAIVTAKYTWGPNQNNKYVDFYVKSVSEALVDNEVLIAVISPKIVSPLVLNDLSCSTAILPYANIEKIKYSNFNKFVISPTSDFSSLLVMKGSAFINGIYNKVNWDAPIPSLDDIIDRSYAYLHNVANGYDGDENYAWIKIPTGTSGSYIAGKVQIDFLFLKGILPSDAPGTKPSLGWSSSTYTFSNPANAPLVTTGLNESNAFEITNLILDKIANIQTSVSITGKLLAIVYRVYGSVGGLNVTELLPSASFLSTAFTANINDVIGTSFSQSNTFLPITTDLTAV